ncbi:bactofilin family protein [Neptunomonas concharum]|jgi:cytoskeletal protein CcmA (bactofilin family)|uniref:Polymer-forming cytoskeletal protein n=1 Tax=Neptunomonas concharum TaxID=1031538 RepID=A0A5P1R903_9GAMM|nr:polymer-forming cytoskeletal protein [Neptunomonas concharum]QEQ96129.1 polymer-forming cytoskeletal protein [Neptunomonas concharum]
MGILKKSVSSQSNRSAITIIAEGNKFSGDMSIIGKMHIDGMFEGHINSLDNISIGKTGHVSGTIRAKHLNVSGMLEGEVICEELHIEKGGQVRANVLSKKMSIDPAGCFLGERRQQESSSLNAISAPEYESGIDAIDSLPDKITLSAPENEKGS